ncbi:hypothetical protein D3C81_1891830 [compost metagenome]
MQQNPAGAVQDDNTVQWLHIGIDEILQTAGGNIGHRQPVFLQLGGRQLLDQADAVLAAGDIDALLAVEQGRGVQYPGG